MTTSFSLSELDHDALVPVRVPVADLRPPTFGTFLLEDSMDTLEELKSRGAASMAETRLILDGLWRIAEATPQTVRIHRTGVARHAAGVLSP